MLDTIAGPRARPHAEVVAGLGALAGRYDLVFCDVWGVLHDGISAFPAAGDALRRFRSGGGRVVLVSNAPRPGALVASQLSEFGVPGAAFDEIVTSGDLTRAMVAERGDAPVHFIGPERDLGLFRGLPARFSAVEASSYVVCTGLVDDEVETVADYAATLAGMRERGLLMVCANPDIVVERGDRLILCAGALAAAYAELGGEVVMPGKPHAPVYEAALAAGARLIGRAPPRGRVLAIGDAIRTDIAGGDAFGIDTLLVARGIHAAELPYAEGVFDLEATAAWLDLQPVRPTWLARELVWA